MSVGLAALLALPVHAETPSFADLLARAETQAAAGHRWNPPGDNMTETVAGMMDLIPTATTEQLSQLSALLEKDAPRPSSGDAGFDPPPDMRTATAPSAAEATRTPRVGPAAPPAAETDLVVPPAAPRVNSNAMVRRTVGPRALELFGRGQQSERQGDVSAARRYFASAAAQGHAAAARALGRLYDPAYLKQTALGGIDHDPALARRWYEQAVAMGDVEAGPLLEALSMR